MRTNLSLLLATVMLLFALSSCNKKDEVYSCNPQLNTWVKENREQLQNISRERLVAFQSIDSQFAAYRILTPEAKCAVWKRKMQIVINEYGLTDAENAHLRMAIDYVKPEFWNEDDDRLLKWGTEWEHKAMTNFSWDTAKTVLIAETWLTGPELAHLKDLMMKARVATKNAKTTATNYTPEPAKPDCTCYFSIWCSFGGMGVCLDGGCNEVRACKVFGSGTCTGRCG